MVESLLRVDVAVDHELGGVVAELDDDDCGRNRTAIFFSFRSSFLAEEGFLHYLYFSSTASSSICFPPLGGVVVVTRGRQGWRRFDLLPAAAMGSPRGIFTSGPLIFFSFRAREFEMAGYTTRVDVHPRFARHV